MTSCAAPNAHADAMAKPVGLQRDEVAAGLFVLTTFVRITRPDLPLTVYIEGDGLAGLSRTEPSDDPTPHKALGLALAVADPGANVVYLARPCSTPTTTRSSPGGHSAPRHLRQYEDRCHPNRPIKEP